MGVQGFAAGQMMQPHPLGAGFRHPMLEPAAPLETAPMSVGEFVGWRIWQVRPRERLLASYSANAIWMPGEPMDGKPSDHGHEGVWAFKDGCRAAAKVRELPQAAFGSVYLWGNVVEHRDGYRSEFAEVRSIDWAGPESMRLAPSGPDEMPEYVTIERYTNPKTGQSVAFQVSDSELLAGLRARYGVGSAEDADLADSSDPESGELSL